MKISEFIDTYSDDLISLHEARAALLSHPLRSEYTIGNLIDASFCRMLAVFVIGSLEALLETWRDRDRVSILDKYFSEKVTNGDKITSLYDAFQNAGINVDKEVFEDFLAIKYLRNTIIHGRWKSHEKEWLEKRGFPLDTRKLTKSHIDRIEHVNQNMMFYVFLTSQVTPGSRTPAGLLKLDETLTRRRDESGILAIEDLNRLIWNNLERIDFEIYAAIEATMKTPEYALRAAEIDGLEHQQVKRLFYLAALRAAKQGYEGLTRYKSTGHVALAYWREYWNRVIAPSDLSEERVRKSLKILESPSFEPQMAEWSVITNAPAEAAEAILEGVLNGDEPFTCAEVVDALRTGKAAYDLLPNPLPISWFTVRIPLVDPNNTAVYTAEAERALPIFRLNRVWYYCVEHRQRFVDPSFDFYARFGAELMSDRGDIQ
jgi:hypothetical protein